VIYCGGRLGESSGGAGARRVDALVHVARPRTTDPKRVIGAKPAAFCFWMFDLLGARPGDDFVDLFPGSGGVTRAWQVYESRSAHADASVLAGTERVGEDRSDASAQSRADASVEYSGDASLTSLIRSALAASSRPIEDVEEWARSLARDLCAPEVE
jgi:hypothetical protein